MAGRDVSHACHCTEDKAPSSQHYIISRVPTLHCLPGLARNAAAAGAAAAAANDDVSGGWCGAATTTSAADWAQSLFYKI